MPLQSETYTNVGGGSTSTVCTPSPSDEVAILGNLIKRISDIEKFLSQLVGADVYASNLSELAKDLGNVLNGTIMLPSTGSPLGPGGSIPVPADFNGTVISGNVITTWTNGVVSFEVTPSSGITVGGGGGVSDYLVLRPASTVLGFGNVPDISDVIFSLGSAFGTSNLSTGQIDIVADGYYHVSINILAGGWGAPGSAYMEVSVPSMGSIRDSFGHDINDTNSNKTWRVSFGFEATVGDYVYISFTDITALFNIANSIVTIEKMA